jgi:hypothetical protein
MSAKWINATLAIKMMKEMLPTYDPRALVSWAYDGKLKTRASKIHFTDNDYGYVEVGEGNERAIPRDFWWPMADRGDANWTTGELSATVIIDEGVCERWTIFGLEVCGSELHALLTEIMSPPVKATQSSSLTWQPKQITREQRELFQYFETPALYRHFVNQELRPGEHYLKYCEWVRQVPSRKKPLPRSSFIKWRKRYDEGHRIDGHKWV